VTIGTSRGKTEGLLLWVAEAEGLWGFMIPSREQGSSRSERVLRHTGKVVSQTK